MSVSSKPITLLCVNEEGVAHLPVRICLMPVIANLAAVLKPTQDHRALDEVLKLVLAEVLKEPATGLVVVKEGLLSRAASTISRVVGNTLGDPTSIMHSERIARLAQPSITKRITLAIEYLKDFSLGQPQDLTRTAKDCYGHYLGEGYLVVYVPWRKESSPESHSTILEHSQSLVGTTPSKAYLVH